MSPADALAILRILLTIPIVWAIRDGPAAYASVLFFIAAATDVVDGWVARRSGALTPRGAFLDPLADKVLVLACLLALTSVGVIQSVLVAFVVARELVVLALRVRAYRAGARLPASGWAKIKTACEMVGVLLLTTQGSGFPILGTPLIAAALVIGLITLPRYLPQRARRVA